MKRNPRVMEGLLDSELGPQPVFVPLSDLTDDEIAELPRQSFSQEEFDSLDVWVREEILMGKESRDNIDGISSSLITRIDWADDSVDDHEDYDESFEYGLKEAAVEPDFLENLVPDVDDNIGDLIATFGPELGVPLIEKHLREYLSDVEYYEKTHDNYYYPAPYERLRYFTIPVSREIYFTADDIYNLDSAYPEEIKAAWIEANTARHHTLGDVGFNITDLLKMAKEGGEFQAYLDPTESYSYTPKWEYIVEAVTEELNELMPDIPASTDPRTYEERKLYTFKDGAYWVELITDELPGEGDALHHCIGDPDEGYPRAVHNREVRVYSLRTASGRSKITAAFTMGMAGPQGPWKEIRVRDIKGAGNRQIGWAKSSEGEGKGKVKWMEIQKVGKLLELLGFDPEEFAPDAGMTAAHDAMRELGGEAAKLTQNPLEVSSKQIRRAVLDGRGTFVTMPAIDFLELTTTNPDMYPTTENLLDEALPLDEYNEWTEEGEILVSPFLKIADGGKVVGHEGRHRAAALINAEGPDAEMLVAIMHRGKLPVLWLAEFRRGVSVYAGSFPRHTAEEAKEAVGGPVFTQNPSPKTEENILKAIRVIRSYSASNHGATFADIKDLVEESELMRGDYSISSQALSSVLRNHKEALEEVVGEIEYFPANYARSGRGAFGGQRGRVVPGGTPGSYNSASVSWSQAFRRKKKKQ